jgi:DNA-binding beta-propeller fold protein YncE
VAPVAAASGVTLAVGLAVALGGQVHRGGHADRADDGRAETAYVFNSYQGTVTPISPVTGKLGKPVTVGPRGYLIGNRRRHVQESRTVQDLILPDGTTNYALYFEGRGLGASQALRRTSLVTGAAGRPIQIGRGVHQVLITPDGTTAYVTNAGGSASTIRPVSLATGTVGKPILRASRASTPWITAAMTPDGRTIYALYLRQGTVTPIATATNTPGKPIPVPKPYTVEFTPSGRTAYVIGAGTVTPISTAANTPGATIDIGRYAGDWALAPDGRTVYVVEYGGTSVTPISLRTGKAGKPIPLHGIRSIAATAITPDGRTLYVTNFKDNTVIPISLATNTAGRPLDVTGEVLNIVITPDGRTAYVFSGEAGEQQVVTPISTATDTLGKPIRTAPNTVVLIPGDQNTP